jgi:hypothetical protein
MEVNFERLVRETMDAGTTEAFENLLGEVRKLPYQYLLMSPSDHNRPFVGQLEDKLWLFLFSSPEEVSKYGPNILGQDKPLYYTKIPTESAIPWLIQWEEHAGVYGIRFNQGPFGFYFKLSDLVETNFPSQESRDQKETNENEKNSEGDAQPV